MEKGKLGLRLSFYGVTAFILAFLGYSTLLFLLAGVAIIVEKDEWTTRQVIQAFCVCLVSSLIGSALTLVEFIKYIPIIGVAWGTIMSVITGVINLLVFIFCLVALINNSKGKDANIPLAKTFANWAVGIINQNTNYNQNAYQQPNNFNQGANNFNQQPNNMNQGVNNFNQQPNNMNQGVNNNFSQPVPNVAPDAQQPQQ